MAELQHGDTIVIVRPGPPTQDAYGNDVPGPPTEIPIENVAVEPRDGSGAGSNEIVNARDTVFSGLTLYAPFGTDVRPTDQIRVDGVLYDVDGRPGPGFRSPFTGSQGPLLIALSLVTG